jgi:hypothetical protein
VKRQIVNLIKFLLGIKIGCKPSGTTVVREHSSLLLILDVRLCHTNSIAQFLNSVIAFYSVVSAGGINFDQLNPKLQLTNFFIQKLLTG